MTINRIAKHLDLGRPTRPPLRHYQFLWGDGKTVVEVDLVLARRSTIDTLTELLGGEWARVDLGPVSAAVKLFW